MTKAVAHQLDLIGTAAGLAQRTWLLVAVVLVCLVAGLTTADPQLRLSAMVAGTTFSMLAIFTRGALLFSVWRDRRSHKALTQMMGRDATPCFTTNGIGLIGFQNNAAVTRFGAKNGATLISGLHDHFASPSSVLYRLQSRAMNLGAAQEDVVTRRGHTRLSVHRIGATQFLWRLEEFLDRGGPSKGAESLSLPMLIANKSGVVLFANEALRRLLGTRPKRLDRVFADQTLRSGEEIDISGIDGPIRAILAEVEGSGERRELYLMPLPSQQNQPSTLADFEHLPLALMKFDSTGDMSAANTAARDLVGLTQEEAISFSDLFDGLGRSVMDWLSDVIAERLPSGSEVLQLRRSDQDTFFQISLRRIVEFGRPGVLAVLNDATALKTMEAQFVQSQKMQAIGQLAGGIAHDFNNLLTAISGHCDLLLLRHDHSDTEYADLVQINQNANRAAALVGQLLAFSRKQTLKPAQLNLHEVLSDLTHLLNRLVGERVTLRLTHASDLGDIRADKRQLEQVLMNLVVNARDAMPQGGTIRIETEALTLREEMRRDRAVVPSGNYAAIRVVDSGGGILPDRLQKIFEPFFTTKRVGEGTGLGLSTAYGIVKQSGGFIFVDSEMEVGTVFHCTFLYMMGQKKVLQNQSPTPRKP